jgi:hypothetical protein
MTPAAASVMSTDATATAATTVAVSPAVAAEVIAAPAVAPIAAPAASVPTPTPAPAPAAAPVDLERALEQSGLVLVQTKATAPQPAEPEPAFVPARRERRAPPADLNTPMQQVETQK